MLFFNNLRDGVKIHVYKQYGDTTGVQYYILQGPWVKRLRQLPREQKVLSDNTITACTSRVDFYISITLPINLSIYLSTYLSMHASYAYSIHKEDLILFNIAAWNRRRIKTPPAPTDTKNNDKKLASSIRHAEVHLN